MLQRVQSLFLLGVIICMVILLLVPVWSASFEGVSTADRGTGVEMDAYYIDVVNDEGLPMPDQSITVAYIAILAVIIAGVAFYEIFRYKNRKQQLKIGALNTILMCLLLGAMFLGVYMAEAEFNISDDEYLIGFFLPPIAIILNLFANRHIRKDERLVRSMDRLR